ncbi:hypothetical protein AB0K00_17235 [Dactylosporangium sp. NPDC049525]|uniref:hypothetical protein n=1 Tax=Dactylosporangium sp. NPDC049525 TaxID=3154730 RepID=UPI00342C59FF
MRKAGAGSSGMTMQRKYDRLARGEFFEPVVEVATAYVTAAIVDAAKSEGEYWALSCLPGTTPGRLSALTMRATDIVVIYQVLPKTPGSPVDALMIVEKSTLESGFGRRTVAQERYPHLQFVDSDYYGAGEDQMMVRGPYDEIAAVLQDPVVAEAAQALAQRVMGSGRVLFARGHNRILADHALGRATSATGHRADG